MDRYRVKPKEKVKLADWDPRDTGDFKDGKEEGTRRLLEIVEKQEALQELLFAEHKHRLMVVLQGMDTSGKDGIIRQVFEGVNPQGVKVASFKVPTPEELDHDYLWRIHAKVPAKGEIVIFNRSHYEDVLVVRVHNLVSEKVWKKRFDQIRNFEQMLVDEGVTIVKFFLHISKDEQKERLQARIDEKAKNWKFNPGDLEERKIWDQYMAAYEDVLNKTSTVSAPWYIVPSDRKWFRNLVVAEVLLKTLKDMKMQYPPAPEGIDQIVIE